MLMDEPGQATKHWLRAQSALGRRAALPSIAATLIGIVCAITQAWCIAIILAWALRADGTAPSLAPFIGFALLGLARAGLNFLAERAALDAGAAGRRRLRGEALTRMLHAGPAIFRTQHSGALTAAVIDRIEALDGLFARWIPAAAVALIGPLIVLLAVAAVDWGAALVLAVLGMLVPLGMALAGLGAAAASGRQFLALTRLQARFLDRVRGIATIVLANRAGDEAAALARSADELRRRTMRVLRVAFLSSAVLDCAIAAAVIILAIREWGIISGIDAGRLDIALFTLLLVPEFFAPLRAFSAAYQDRMHAAGAAGALAQLPKLPEPATALAQPIRTVPAHGVTIAFEQVGFTWDAARGPALSGVNFRVPAGETMVLLGPSGAGKSTILEILLGFIRPETGRVTINGAPIESIVPEALSRMTGWIGQKPILFSGTLEENLRFAKPDATDAEIAKALRNASADGFVAALPQGLATPIGEGGYGLSGGQAQRIAIARAFLKNAPLLLMDEPTAHLDPATEAEVLESLRRLAVGRTVILASHAAAAHSFGGRRLELRDGQAQPARGVA